MSATLSQPPVAAATTRQGVPIDDESSPIQDQLKIGIELEGIGSVKVDWTRKPAGGADFEKVFKRMPLIRSNSFDGKRGVYINPEESKSREYRPAELVSSPHQVTVDALIALRNSLWKFLRKRTELKGICAYDDKRVDAVTNPPIAKTTLIPQPVPEVTGALQTTVGVRSKSCWRISRRFARR